MIVRRRRVLASNYDSIISVIQANAVIRVVIRAMRRLLNVAILSDQVGNFRHISRTLDHYVLFAGGLKLLHVADARSALGLIAVLDEVRDRNSGQNGDDGDHDHDFNEGKTLQEVFHGCVPFFWLFICVDTMPTQNLICKPHAKIDYV